MKKIYGIVLLFACLLFAGCNKAIVVTDDALSGAVMTGEVEVTGMIETGVVDTMTGIQDSMTGVVMLQ